MHVHIAEGVASVNATKVWITSAGGALLCNNHSKIPDRILRGMIRVIESNSEEIIEKWSSQFGETGIFVRWKASWEGRCFFLEKQKSVLRSFLMQALI